MGNAGATGMLQVGAMIGVEVANNEPLTGGSQLQGKVYLQVEKEKVSALCLVVRFIGQEKVCVTDTQESGSTDDTTTETTYASATSEIVKIEVILAQFPSGEVTRGRYEFPFVLDIPFNLPGTQGKVALSDYFAVQYTLGAELVRPAGMLNFKVANSTEVFIEDLPAIGPPVPSALPPYIIPVSSCCFSQGHMQLTANVDNTCPAMGELINVSFAVDNQSRAPVRAVEVVLLQLIRGVAQRRSFSVTTTLFRLRIPCTVAPGSQTRGVDASSLQTLPVSVPVCRPSFRGKIGSVSHVLLVRACTPACTANPVIEVRLRIHGSRAMFRDLVPVVEAPFQLPADWRPQIIADSSVAEVPVATVVELPATDAEEAPAQAQGIPGGLLTTMDAQNLILQLQSCSPLQEVAIVHDWLAQGGNVDELSPDLLRCVFSCIRQEMSYSAVAEEMGAAMMGKLTLFHVAGAASGCPESHKGAVCVRFAAYVQDKSAASSVLRDAGLSQAALDKLLAHYSS
eukprot:gene38507-46808_t